MGMPDKQILENPKESFPLKIESQVHKIDNINVAIVEEQVLVLLLKSKLP